MQDLRIILIILGAVAIAALLIHGLWTSQKGRQKPMREKPMGKVDNQPSKNTDDPFDSDGIGKVRVLDSHQAASLSRDHEIEDDWQISPHFSAMSDDDSDEPSLGLPPTLSSSVFAEDPDDDNAEAPDFLTPSSVRATPKSALAQKNSQAASGNQGAPTSRPTVAGRESAAELRARQYRQGEIDPLFDNHEQASRQSEPQPAVRQPKYRQPEPRQPAPRQQERRQSAVAEREHSELQTSLSTDSPVRKAPPAVEPVAARPTATTAQPIAAEPSRVEPRAEPSIEPNAKPNIKPEATPIIDAHVEKPAPITKTWQDVYVISLVAKPNQVLTGTDLMRAVTEVGFTFGDMDIFHRYQGSSTQGEALFSLANMVNPGTFTPDAMSEFTTPGVTIFMQLPKPGSAKNNFNMMIQAASNMAEALDALLLDGQRQALGLDYLVRCRGQLNDFDSQA